MSVHSSTRRLFALPQLAAGVLALGSGLQISACPPGMDMGMDMPMPVSVADPVVGGGQAQPTSGMDCPFGGSMDEEGRANCPLAVGGIGVCGTGVPTPSESVAVLPPASLGEHAQLSVASHGPEYRTEIQLPPPRA